MPKGIATGMGFFSKPTYETVEVRMIADLYGGAPEAAVEWTSHKTSDALTSSALRIAACSFLFSRQLTNHKPTRYDLLSTMKRAAPAIPDGAEKFVDAVGLWQIEVGGIDFQICPWHPYRDAPNKKPKTYRVTLQQGARDKILPNLKMSFGQEAILVPLSVLSVVESLAEKLEKSEREVLASALREVVDYFEADERNFRIGGSKRIFESIVADLACKRLRPAPTNDAAH